GLRPDPGARYRGGVRSAQEDAPPEPQGRARCAGGAGEARHRPAAASGDAERGGVRGSGAAAVVTATPRRRTFLHVRRRGASIIAGAGSARPGTAQRPSTLLLTRMFTATRRFCALPSGVVLSASGSASAIPVGVSIR